nr:ABC transporter substrate-binding protein [Propionibacterium sp.]
MALTRRTVLGALALVPLAGCAAQPAATTPAASATSAGTTAAAKTYKIGIVQIVTHPSLDAVRTNFVEELKKQGVTAEVDYKNPEGDQSTLNTIAQGFAADKKDLVLAIATPSALAVAQAISDKPILFAAVTDPVGAKLVASLDAPGKNVTGTSDMNPIDKQIALVKQLVPNAKTIGMVYSSAEQNSLVQLELAKTEGAKVGLTVVGAAITNSSEVQQGAQSLVGKIDAFFIGTDNTVVSGLEGLISVAQTAKLPIITADGDSVKRGAVASWAVDYGKMGVQTAQMAAKILAGAAQPATMPVGFQDDPVLTINTAAAAKIGLTIPDAVKAAADVTL